VRVVEEPVERAAVEDDGEADLLLRDLCANAEAAIRKRASAVVVVVRAMNPPRSRFDIASRRRTMKDYSYRSASMGERRAAFQAG
jgi:hypothetical protein